MQKDWEITFVVRKYLKVMDLPSGSQRLHNPIGPTLTIWSVIITFLMSRCMQILTHAFSREVEHSTKCHVWCTHVWSTVVGKHLSKDLFVYIWKQIWFRQTFQCFLGSVHVDWCGELWHSQAFCSRDGNMLLPICMCTYVIVCACMCVRTCVRACSCMRMRVSTSCYCFLCDLVRVASWFASEWTSVSWWTARQIKKANQVSW